MPGKLYLCATPIGNLQDITPRCIEVLKGVDLIAAEDTRNSIKILNHFDIHTPMTAYHEYNRFDKADDLVRQLLEGKNIACITDAGTPGISDPGEVFVKKVYEAGIPVTSIPGACALVNALVISGLSTRRFRFEAFLPAEKKERAEILREIREDTATLVFYEAPHHLGKTLAELLEALGDRRTSLVKELTKTHENVELTTLGKAAAKYAEEEPRGEYVLVVEGKSPEEKREEAIRAFDGMSLSEHMELYTGRGIDRKEAMKLVAKDRGLSKRDVYQALIEAENTEK